MSDQVIRIEVTGNPRAQGSKRAHAVYRKGPGGKPVPVTDKNGRVVVAQREMAEGLGEWRTSIAQRVAEQYDGPVIDGPVFVDLTFYLVRPQSHYGSGKRENMLKDSAPLYVEKSPDLDKLTRGVMDGLKGALYRDDKFFCLGTIRKDWVHKWERPGVLIEARVPTRRTVGDQRAAEAAQRQPELPVAA
jgi:Holliday junction resolvase RusA-like endonuclease